MRNRKTNNIKNIKDYIVPIIIFSLIFTLLYFAFSDSNSTSNWTNDIPNNNSKTSKSLEITFWSIDAEVEVIDNANKKRSLKNWWFLNMWESIIIKSWDVAFSVPEKANFKLNTNWKIIYLDNSDIKLESNSLWVETINKQNILTKYATISIWQNSIANIEQNEVNSTLYLLKWKAEIKTLAGLNTFISPWKKILISNKNTSDADLDLNLLKEDFDAYFPISDWYLKNNGWVYTNAESSNNIESSTWVLIGSGKIEVEKKNMNISGLLSFDNIYDEWFVNSKVINVSWKFLDNRISKIIINWKKAIINSENKIFNLVWVNTGNKENDIKIKIYDSENNILWKYLYTLYYNEWKNTNDSAGFSKVNTESYPVNWEDFIINIPTVTNGETYSSENTFYWTVKNPNVKSVTVNGYKLKTFNWKKFRYHAFEKYNNLWEWVNNYEIKYFNAAWEVILKKYVTINKKSKKLKSSKKISNEAGIN